MIYGNGVKVLETELKQRAFDGKWQLLGRVFDEENKYQYRADNGSIMYMMPTKWITLGVYDYLLEFED